MKGTVKFFNKTKGFGFIISDEDEKEYFVHFSDILDDAEIVDGDIVEFEVVTGDRGPKASKVTK